MAQVEHDSYTAMLGSIFENSLSAIYVKDLDGRYLLANPRVVEFLGVPEEEILGRTDLFDDPALAQGCRDHDRRAETGSYRLEEWSDAFADGRHYFDSVKFPLFDASGELYGTCGVSLDVTERRRAVEAAAEARDEAVASAAAKSTFLATMSHEIRTPMNAVIGMTDLLMDTDLDDQQYEFLETVRTSGEALLAVINDILDFSKIDAGEMELESAPFNLRDEIESCLDLVVVATTAKGLELICDVDESCPERVIGDVVRLRQIVANLLSNAVKFTQQGEVLVSVRCVPTTHRRLRVTISVTDTGIGISTAGLDRLFGSFSQVDASTTRVYGGTGLGLAISQRLAEAMNGEVEVTSTLGVGSTFTVTLVLDSSADPVRQPGRSAAAGALVGHSVLLVDDNAAQLRTLTSQLTSWGMVCTPAMSPAIALALVAGGLHYDVAVLDQHMPQMEGAELSQALQRMQEGADTPHVLLTTMGSRPASTDGPVAAYLTKPVKRCALQEALVAALSRQPRDLSPAHPRVAGSPQPSRPLRILLAEDNPVNQRVAQLVLAKLGHQVDIVDNGLDAVRAIERGAYDVVLMDVQMPQMDGLEATSRVRAKPSTHQPYIVAVTAGALLEDREACLAAGMDNYLAKPVRAKELQDLLLQFTHTPDLTPFSAAGKPGLEDAPRMVLVDMSLVGGEAADANPLGGGTVDAGLPAIDLTVFEELMTQLDDGDGQLQDNLIPSYLADGALHVTKLAAAVAAGDATTAAICAHTLRSTSALLGAEPLADLLQRTETAARTSPGELDVLTALVGAEYARVGMSLRHLAAQGKHAAASRR